MDILKNGEFRIINADKIVDPPHPDRLEVTAESVEDLVSSMRLIGHKTPITVRPVGDKFEVVAGHRRFRACLIAGIINIKCIIENLTNDEADDVKAHENLYRKDLDPMEEAVAISRIVGEDMAKVPEVARRRGKSEQWVWDRLQILEYPAYFWPAIKGGTIKLGVAKALAQIEDDTYRQMFFDNAVRDGMPVWQAEYYLAQWKGGVFKKGEEIRRPTDEDAPDTMPIIRQKCVACNEMAEAPNLTSVFVHRECPKK